ncbi:hypothetical protein D8W73_00790 [Citrobacter amalonaticus]|nr:hypothetical protein [Citrobacter amalonaticus]
MSNDFNNIGMSGPVSTRVNPKYLTMMLEALEPHLTYRPCPVGKRFTYSATKQLDCYIIRSGAISLSRQPDDILLELLEAPTIRGLTPVDKTSQSMFVLRVIEPSEVAILKKDVFYSLLTELNLWQVYAKHLELVVGMGGEVLCKLVSPSAYLMVRYQLYELMSKPLTLRSSITAENYIRSKTRLSRSSIMNTLSVLKTGGYISIEDGRLIEIKHIPTQL